MQTQMGLLMNIVLGIHRGRSRELVIAAPPVRRSLSRRARRPAHIAPPPD
jgi:hypothetical protein